MKLELYHSQLAELTKAKHFANGFVIVLGLALMIQAWVIFALHDNQRIVLIPPQLEKSAWVESKKVSQGYLESLTQFHLSLLLNTTPKSIEFQQEQILRHVAPRYYGLVKAKLLEDQLHLKQKNVSSVFYPINMKTDATKLNVEVTGDFTALVGKTQTQSNRKTYVIRYENHNGKLLIKSFEEVRDEN